jgi:hypothetical protein
VLEFDRFTLTDYRIRRTKFQKILHRAAGEFLQPLCCCLATNSAAFSPEEIQVETAKIGLERAKIDSETKKIGFQNQKIGSPTGETCFDRDGIDFRTEKIGAQRRHCEAKSESPADSEQFCGILNSPSAILAPSRPQSSSLCLHTKKFLERSGDDFGELARSQLDRINGIELD